MNLPETCPFCGEGVALDYRGHRQISEVRAHYHCDTVIVDGYGIQRWQSDKCAKSQQVRAVDRLREAEARIATLEGELERKALSANTRLDCALVRGNRLRNVMSMLTPPDEDTRLLMHAAADEWDKFIRITTDSRNASKAWQASNKSRGIENAERT